MRKSSKDISKQVSEKHGYDYEMVKSVFDTIFSELEMKSKNPTHLIINIAPLGNFFFRKSKSKILVGAGKFPDLVFQEQLKKILDLYQIYDTDKLDFKITRFGKESHEAYLLAKEQKKLLNKKEVERKKHIKFSGSRNKSEST